MTPAFMHTLSAKTSDRIPASSFNVDILANTSARRSTISTVTFGCGYKNVQPHTRKNNILSAPATSHQNNSHNFHSIRERGLGKKKLTSRTGSTHLRQSRVVQGFPIGTQDADSSFKVRSSLAPFCAREIVSAAGSAPPTNRDSNNPPSWSW